MEWGVLFTGERPVLVNTPQPERSIGMYTNTRLLGHILRVVSSYGPLRYSQETQANSSISVNSL